MILMNIWTKEVQENDDGSIDEMGQFEQSLIQNCNLIAFPTNNDLNRCIMGNDPVQSFIIASFTETPTKIYVINTGTNIHLQNHLVMILLVSLLYQHTNSQNHHQKHQLPIETIVPSSYSTYNPATQPSYEPTISSTKQNEINIHLQNNLAILNEQNKGYKNVLVSDNIKNDHQQYLVKLYLLLQVLALDVVLYIVTCFMVSDLCCLFGVIFKLMDPNNNHLIDAEDFTYFKKNEIKRRFVQIIDICALLSYHKSSTSKLYFGLTLKQTIGTFICIMNDRVWLSAFASEQITYLRTSLTRTFAEGVIPHSTQLYGY